MSADFLSDESGNHLITDQAVLPLGPGWPDLAEYKEWARIAPSDIRDDPAIDQALAAVTYSIVQRCPTLASAQCPYEVQYATLLWTNRLLSRRNSPDGIVGVADLGIATVSRADKDILQMLSPWLDQVIA